jgi:hypothetical protein
MVRVKIKVSMNMSSHRQTSFLMDGSELSSSYTCDCRLAAYHLAHGFFQHLYLAPCPCKQGLQLGAPTEDKENRLRDKTEIEEKLMW